MPDLSSSLDDLRRRAVRRLAGDGPGLVSEEALEDLRIHQVELELQNQELRETQVQLETSRAALHELFELAPVPYLVVREDGRIERANLTLAQLLGEPREALSGSFFERFVLVGQRNRFFELLRVVAATGEARTWEGGLTTASSNLQVMFSCRPERRLGGSSPARLLLAVVDISERREAERARQRALQVERQARKAAERAERAKSEFLANITHELRTPLTSIISAARLLETMPKLEAQKPLIEVLQSAAPTLLGLIDNVVTVSLLESGNLPRRLENTRIRELLDEAVRVVSLAARRAGTTVDVEVAPDVPPTMELDRAVVRQIVVNLLGNAVKFTPEGAVNVAVSHEGDCLLLAVRDTGIGFDPESVDVFARFVQADGSSTRAHGGSGLGLAICKGLVEQLQGTIRVESAPGRGSTFTVRVPARATGAGSPESGRTDAAGDDPSTRSAKVLVVDDDRDIRFVTQVLLKDSGIEDVSTAASGEEALELLCDEGFDVVLLDLQMPGIDGVETVRRLRRIETELAIRPTKVVAFTARRTGEDRPIEPPPGFDGLLEKPFEPAEVVATIRGLVHPTAGDSE